ncbi:hypothetical protein OSB04_001116 [Centaurea solstitialis]|uniref:Fe2OG dioxygenase domain-containing protein n=1 Tax=Centaurea solstitialis TaxID=347529 RepID=A0AA38U250_9ASTR|nr:hypothetical protein OSB04_001116 [Centaurea solstitialis]
MAQLVSSWSNGVQSVPEDYLMPPEKRPGDSVSVCNEIPVIDLHENLKNNRSDIIKHILKACQEFGLFQVINHGVSEKMMEDVMVLYHEFFNMSIDDKLCVYSETPLGAACSLYPSSLNYAKEDVHFWRDILRHLCHPLEEHTPSWPDKPSRYRQEVGRYAIEVRKMGFKILDLIAEGLGLKDGYFNEVSQNHTMAINHYPPCPDPSLAMGIGAHRDANLITFIQQDQYGLQMYNHGKWMGIEPIPNAFVINIGYQLEIISNGKLKSVEHRGVTSSTAARTSITTFVGPNLDHSVAVEPAKELVTSTSPRKFKSYQFNNFIADYLAYSKKPVSRDGTLLDLYRL